MVWFIIMVVCRVLPCSKDLVVGGLITAEEFWANRLNQGVGGASDPQESGLPSAFLVTTVVPTSSAG